MTDQRNEAYEKFTAFSEQGKSEEALKWLDIACENGCAEALIAKAKIVGTDDAEALNEYRRLIDEACEHDSGEAWALKGDLMLLLPAVGEEILALEDGVDRGKKEEFITLLPMLKKFDCYVKAASLDWLPAFSFLGTTLLDPKYGFLAEQDALSEGFAYIRRGAAKGDGKCALLLAECLEDGTGTEKNIPDAIKLYEELASAGDKNAMLHLCEIYSEGRDGVLPDREKAIKYMMMTGLEFNN